MHMNYQRFCPQPLGALHKEIIKKIQPKTTKGPVGIFPKDQNLIGSVVTEILRDERTARHQATLYFFYKLSRLHYIHPYIKVTGSLCVCLYRRTLLTYEPIRFSFTVQLLIGPGKVHSYFWGGYLHPTKKYHPSILCITF